LMRLPVDIRWHPAGCSICSATVGSVSFVGIAEAAGSSGHVLG
jgi:hypothetical protein